MAPSITQQTLIDRAAISDVIIAYARAVDTRDWDLFLSLFTERVFLDFRSFDPSVHYEVDATELLAMSRRAEAFDATQHISANHAHSIEGDRAICTSYMQAAHFLTRPDGNHSCILYGQYSHSLIRTERSWKIDRYSLAVWAQQGEPRVFEWAGYM